MAGHNQSRRFLECIEDNFLMHMTDELVREGALLEHLQLTSGQKLVDNVKGKGNFCCSNN